jgi:hypothetical protein
MYKSLQQRAAQFAGPVDTLVTRIRSGRSRLGLPIGQLDGDVLRLQCREKARAKRVSSLIGGTATVRPLRSQELQVLPNRGKGAGVGSISRCEPPMQMGSPIAQRFVVQFLRAEDTPDCSSDLGHLGQVIVSCASIQIVQFVNTGLCEKEA